MKRIYNRDQRLESHPWFSYIAWTVVIGFALFVYNLIGTVAEQRSVIQKQVIQSNNYVYTPPPTN